MICEIVYLSLCICYKLAGPIKVILSSTSCILLLYYNGNLFRMIDKSVLAFPEYFNLCRIVGNGFGWPFFINCIAFHWKALQLTIIYLIPVYLNLWVLHILYMNVLPVIKNVQYKYWVHFNAWHFLKKKKNCNFTTNCWTS